MSRNKLHVKLISEFFNTSSSVIVSDSFDIGTNKTHVFYTIMKNPECIDNVINVTRTIGNVELMAKLLENKYKDYGYVIYSLIDNELVYYDNVGINFEVETQYY